MVLALAHQAKECVLRQSHGVPWSTTLHSEEIIVTVRDDHVEFPLEVRKEVGKDRMRILSK